MTAYHFIPGSASLQEQPSGEWKASFKASIYEEQVYHETSNSVNAAGVRVIEFAVLGEEIAPLHNEEGESVPYTRASETQVELVLTKDGKRKNVLYTGYP